MDFIKIDKFDERKQSSLYTGRPIFLGNSIMKLYLNKRSSNVETGEKQLGSFVSEMVEFTKPPHQRTCCFEGPPVSIFGPHVDHSADEEDLHNLDLTMSRTNSMRETSSEFKIENLPPYVKHEDEVFPKTPEEKDVVEIIKKRLSKLRLLYEPPELIEGPADVLIWYKTSRLDNMQLLLRAHSRVLTRHCNAFEELLESGMREMTLREYLDRKFMRTRQFDEISASTEYEVEPSLAWCNLRHPEKPMVIPRVVTEAFIAFQEARKKALLPPPSEMPLFISDEQLLQEKIDEGAFDIVKESHKLVAKMTNLDLPPELREQFEKFASIVAQCIPFTLDTEEIEEVEENFEKEREPYQRTIRISFSDYAPPGWEKLGEERESIVYPRRSTLSKRDSQSHEALRNDTLVRGSLIDGEVIQASEAESNLVGGELPEEEPPDLPFDVDLVRGSLPRGSLREGSELRESLLNGNLVGSEIDPTLQEEDPHLGKAENELAEERVEEERTFFADFLATLPSTPSDVEADLGPPKPPPTYILNKSQWTSSGIHGVMEYLYTEKTHVPCQELPEVFEVANELLLTEVTEAITLMPLVAYLRVALLCEANRSALLELCTIADSVERPDLRTLKKFCESFEYGSNLDRMPYTFSLHTGYIVGRKYEFLEEGFFEYNLVKVNILRIPEPGMKLFKETAIQARHFIITKPHPEWIGAKARIEILHHYPRKFNMCVNRNRDKGWFITVFGPKIAEECYNFYKHIQSWTHKPMHAETFSIRMVMGFLVCPMMQTSIAKSFPKEVKVEEVRGSGYFIGGEPHGNSLTLSGEPRHLLAAAKAIPPNFTGRTSFRVAFPTKKTFIKIFSVAQKFGVDFEMNCIYLLKNLQNIIRALQFFIDVSNAAFVPWDVPREMIELVAPCDPF